MAVGDYDNDGYLDLYLPRSNQAQPVSHKILGRLLRYDPATRVYRDVTIEEDLDAPSLHGTFGAAFLDHDRDGRLDLMITRSYGTEGTEPEIWRNAGLRKGHHLFVELGPPARFAGLPVNGDALNAVIQIWIDKNGNDSRDGGETLTRQQIGYYPSMIWIGPHPIHFGLGKHDATRIKWLRVLWPGVPGNDGMGWEYYTVDEVDTTLFIGYPKAPVIHPEPDRTEGGTNRLSWREVRHAEAFRIECAPDPDFTRIYRRSDWISIREHEFSGLSPGQRYWYRVRCRRGSRESGWSGAETSLQTKSSTSRVRTRPADRPG